MSRFLPLLIAFMLLIPLGCGRSPTAPCSKHNPDTVYVKTAHIKMALAIASTGARAALPKFSPLAKPASIDLSKLIVTMVSSAGDTVRDTITSLNPSTLTPQTINLTYSLKPLRSWKIQAKTLDTRDSVIHHDSAQTLQLNPADTVNVNLPMSAKYLMYEVKFLTLPDSISSSTPGTSKDALHISRLVAIIDSGLSTQLIIDSLGSPYFAPGNTHTLGFNYVVPGVRTLKIYAYGPLNGYDGILYYKSTTLNVAVGSDSTIGLSLDWVGPTTGTSSLSITIGKVGKVTVNGTVPGSVID